MKKPSFIKLDSNTNCNQGSAAKRVFLKLDEEIVKLFLYSNHIKFIYERGSHKLTFVRLSKIEDVPSTAITQQCFGEFIWLDDSLKVPIEFCEVELHFTNLSWKFQTFVSYLKPGKELELLWEPDAYTTPETLEDGIHIDVLSAIVYEGTEHQQHFTLAVHAGKQQSLSRMIIPEELKEELLKEFLTSTSED